MIYLQKSRPTKRGGLFYSLFVASIIIVCVIGLQLFAGQLLERIAMSLGGPFSATYVFLKDKSGNIGAFYHSRTYLVEENKRLVFLIEENREKLSLFESLRLEHESLLSSYGRNQLVASGTLILANVILKPPQSPYDVLVVDVGADRRVTVGQQVFSQGGIPAGRVTGVFGSTAKIALFSSVGEKTHLALERTGESLSVEGRGGGNFETEVGQEMDIVVGDRVVLSQFNGAVVASVVEVEANPTSASRRVFLHSAINVFKLRWVEIAHALFIPKTLPAELVESTQNTELTESTEPLGATEPTE